MADFAVVPYIRLSGTRRPQRRGATLRLGKVDSADDRDDPPVSEIDRPPAEGRCVAFWTDTAFAEPEIERLLSSRKGLANSASQNLTRL